MLKPWSIVSTTIVHQTPWIEVKEEVCRSDSQKLVYTYTRRRDQGPTIIAEENDGRLWMVQQYRHPIKKIIWQFPTEGKINNESWDETARRGLKEELQLTANTMIELGFSYPDPGGLEQATKYYLARDLSVHNYHHHSENEIEDLRTKAFTQFEIETMIQKGEICDNWTFSGLYLYQLFKKNHS